MSMIDWFNRPNENPWESARRFKQTNPFASRRPGQEAVEQAGEQDPLQEMFRPTEIDAPMSVGEQAFEERLAEADELANRDANTAVQLAEMNRQRIAREQQMQQPTATQGQQFAQTGQGQRGPQEGFNVPGNVEGTRQEVLETAGEYIGSPYKFGGRTVKGIDCSGLVMAVYNQYGVDVSQHSVSWQGRNIPGARTAVSNLQPGDLVVWNDTSHIAIYAGNGMIIDASSSGGTRQRKLWTSPNNVYGIKLKFPGE